MTTISTEQTPQTQQPQQPPTTKTLKERIGATNPDGSVQWINSFFYGEPGAGKTYLFGTVVEWPEEFLPALLIDLDGGTDTLRHRKELDISPPIRDLDSLNKLYEELAKDPHHYKTIALDNVSELQKMDMNEVMRDAKLNANDPSKVDINVPSQREWGKNGDRMRIIIRAFRDLPCHTIVFAHMSEREDKMTKIDRIWPGMAGAMRHEILGFFSIGGYMSVYEKEGEVLRQIQFKKTRKVQARDRFQVLPGIMQNNPTLPEIYKLIKESGAHIVDTPVLETPNAVLAVSDTTAPNAVAPNAAQQLQGAINNE